MAGGVGGFIAAAIGFSGTAATVAAVAINTALYIGLSYTSARMARKGLDSGVQPREILVRSASQPKMVVYGEAVVGGLVFYLNQKPITGDQNFELWLGVVHAGHEVEDITDLYYENELLESGAEITWNVSGQVATVDSGPWHATDSTHDACKIWRRFGDSTQVLPTEFTDAFTELSSSHQARGHACTIHRFQIFDESEEVFKGNQPANTRAKVKGRKVYDPRLDSTRTGGSGSHLFSDPSTWEWTDNPVLIAVDYLTQYWAPSPFGEDRIDWEFIMTQADKCDVLVDVPGGTTQKRYTCNGAISLGDTNDDNLEKILDCCLGSRYTVNGKVRIRVGGSETADVTITEDEILRDPGPTIRPALRREDRYNRVTGTYISEDFGFVETEFMPVEDAGFVARDNGEEITDHLTLDLVRNEYQAQRLAYLHLQQSDQQLTVELPLKWSGMRLTPGTYASVTYSKFGWSNKLFRCLSLKIGVRGVPVTAILREDSASAWTDPAVADYSTRSAQGVIVPPDPVVPPPTSMTVTSEIEGNLVEWVNPAGRESWAYVDVYASADSSWANATKVAGRVQSGKFLHQLAYGTQRYYWVRAVRQGVESDREPNSDTSDRTATAGGVLLGLNIRDESGNVLGDTDVRNDQLVTDALSAINFNASMKIPADRNGTRAPAGWITNNSSVLPGYVDPDVHDVATMADDNNTFNGTAIRANPDSEYELVALVRAETGTVDISIRAEERWSELSSGKQYIGSSADGAMAARNTLQTVGSATGIGTTYQILSGTYIPTASAVWFSPSLYGANTGAYRVEWFVVREKSTRNTNRTTFDEHNAAGPIAVSGSGAIQSQTVTSFTVSLPDRAGSAKVEAHYTASSGSVAGTQKSSLFVGPDVSSSQSSNQEVYVHAAEQEQSVRGVFSFSESDTEAEVRLQWGVDAPSGPNDATYENVIIIVEMVTD